MGGIAASRSRIAPHTAMRRLASMWHSPRSSPIGATNGRLMPAEAYAALADLAMWPPPASVAYHENTYREVNSSHISDL